MTKPVEKTIHMSKRQFNSWNRHLVSGKIKQGKNQLINENTGAMCCLGVLEFAIEKTKDFTDAGDNFPSVEWLEYNNIKFFDEHGNEVSSPHLTGGSADTLNDDGMSFKQIAQRLKSRVKFIPEKKVVDKKGKKK